MNTISQNLTVPGMSEGVEESEGQRVFGNCGKALGFVKAAWVLKAKATRGHII